MATLLLLFSSLFTLVELNCENLFDCRHDSLKQDIEFTPEGARHWTRTRYWNKLNHIGQEILSCADELPDVVALCEIENDTVMHDLTRRSLLRNAGYDYLMTESDDVRGIDVALLYQPARFRPLCYDCITVEPVKGITQQRDTLHLFIVHAPSRYGGEKASRPFRLQVANTLVCYLQTTGMENLLTTGNIIVTGDFNDYADSPSLQYLEKRGLVNVSRQSKGTHGAEGTYRFKGEWHSLDHILLSSPMVPRMREVYVNDAPFLLEEEPLYGGYRPRRSFSGYHYQPQGFSDHLPLVIRFH